MIMDFSGAFSPLGFPAKRWYNIGQRRQFISFVLNQTTQHWHTGITRTVQYRYGRDMECMNLVWTDLAPAHRGRKNPIVQLER